MTVSKKASHNDHDQALTSLLDTARKGNVHLNYDQLQYKKQEIDFFGETYTTSSHKPAQSKVSAITAMPAPTCKKQKPPNSQHHCQTCRANQGAIQRKSTF